MFNLKKLVRNFESSIEIILRNFESRRGHEVSSKKKMSVHNSDLSLVILKILPKMNLKYSLVILTKLLLKVGFCHGNLPK